MSHPPDVNDDLPRPGLIGRSIRSAAGLFLLAFLGLILIDYQLAGQSILRNPLVWLGTAYSFWSLPDVGSLPFGLNAQQRPRVVAAMLMLSAGLIDLARTESFFGPTLAFALVALIAFAVGIGGLSYLLAGVLAVPG